MLTVQYSEVLARIAEKARRLDEFMLTAGTSKAAEKAAGAMLNETEGLEKALRAALDVEDGLDYLLSHVTRKENIS